MGKETKKNFERLSENLKNCNGIKGRTEIAKSLYRKEREVKCVLRPSLYGG